MSDRDRPLRVLHCLWGGGVGGAERAVYQLVRGQLRSPDVVPALLFARGEGPYWEATRELDCSVRSASLPSGRALHRIFDVATMMQPYDVHHFHSAEPLTMAASLRCRTAIRVYTHRGGIIDYSLRKRAKYKIAGFLMKRAFHGVSGNTSHAADCAAALFRMDRGRMSVTYNGLDFSLLEPTRPVEAVREALGFEPADFVLGTAAHLRSWKRIDRLLELMSTLPDARLRLLIVGEGEDRPRLERLRERLGLGRRVVFAGRQLKIADYMQAMQAFCLPSMGLESFGNAAVEAMATGVPTIIFADGGGMVEHIEAGKTGFIVDDLDGLVAVMSRLIGDEGLRSQIGGCGRDAIRAKYTLEKATGLYRGLYSSAVRAARA